MDPLYLTLIQSDRVSEKTRDVLLTRARPMEASYEPKVVPVASYEVLRAVAGLLVPQNEGEDVIPLEALLDRQKST